MRPHEASALSEKERSQLKVLFDAFDSDSNGKISVRELARACELQGALRTEQDCARSVVSSDPRGEVDFDGFLRVFPKPTRGQPVLEGLPHKAPLRVWLKWGKGPPVGIPIKPERTVMHLRREGNLRTMLCSIFRSVLQRGILMRVAEYLNVDRVLRDVRMEATTFDDAGIVVDADEKKRVIVRSIDRGSRASVRCRLPPSELCCEDEIDDDGWDSENGSEVDGRHVTVVGETRVGIVELRRVARRSAAHAAGIRRGWRLRKSAGFPVARAEDAVGAAFAAGQPEIEIVTSPPPPPLREGMVLRSIGDDQIRTPSDFQEALDKGKAVGGVTVGVSIPTDACCVRMNTVSSSDIRRAKQEEDQEYEDRLKPSLLRFRVAAQDGVPLRDQAWLKLSDQLCDVGIRHGTTVEALYTSPKALPTIPQEHFVLEDVRGQQNLGGQHDWRAVRETIERNLRVGTEGMGRDIKEIPDVILEDLSTPQTDHKMVVTRTPVVLRDWDWLRSLDKLKAVYRLTLMSKGPKKMDPEVESTCWVVFTFRVYPFKPQGHRKVRR